MREVWIMLLRVQIMCFALSFWEEVYVYVNRSCIPLAVQNSVDNVLLNSWPLSHWNDLMVVEN